MTQIIGSFYLPDSEEVKNIEGLAILTKPITFESVLYDPTPIKFKVKRGEIEELNLVPNVGSTPGDSLYVVILKIGETRIKTFWKVPNKAIVEARSVVYLEPFVSDFVPENDPLFLILVEDANNDGIIDLLEYSNVKLNDIPPEIPNGVIDTFSTEESYVSGTLRVTINGLKMLLTDFEEVDPFNYRIFDPPFTGDTIASSYRFA